MAIRCDQESDKNEATRRQVCKRKRDETLLRLLQDRAGRDALLFWPQGGDVINCGVGITKVKSIKSSVEMH